MKTDLRHWLKCPVCRPWVRLTRRRFGDRVQERAWVLWAQGLNR